jgi:hypothetical protein
MGDFGRNEVAQGVCGVIAALAVIVGIDFEDVFGSVRVVLKIGEAFDEARATGMDEESGMDTCGRVAEAA